MYQTLADALGPHKSTPSVLSRVILAHGGEILLSCQKPPWHWGETWTFFLLPIRTCDLCFCVGHCDYSGHERPSLIAGKISLHPSYQRLRPLLLWRSRYLLKTGTMQIVCWGTKRPIKIIIHESRKRLSFHLPKTTAPCRDKPDCSYKNGLSIDVLWLKTDHEYVYVSRVSPLSEMQFVNRWSSNPRLSLTVIKTCQGIWLYPRAHF